MQEVVASGEKEQLLVTWNDTTTDYPRDVCVHEFFERRVEKRPGAIAIEFDDQSITYRVLNEQANRLARRLRDFGVGPDVIVGLFLDRGPELIVGILGILKAGGAYLPLDVDDPPKRLAYLR